MKNPTYTPTSLTTVNQMPKPQICHHLFPLFLLYSLLSVTSSTPIRWKPLNATAIGTLRPISIFIIKPQAVAVPFPHPIIGAVLLVEANVGVVVADGDGLAGVGLKAVRVSVEDETFDLFLELGLLLGENGIVVFVVQRRIGVVGRILGEPVPGHQGPEREILKVGCGIFLGDNRFFWGFFFFFWSVNFVKHYYFYFFNN